jgi:hypothetical protein
MRINRAVHALMNPAAGKVYAVNVSSIISTMASFPGVYFHLRLSELTIDLFADS